MFLGFVSGLSIIFYSVFEGLIYDMSKIDG